MKRGKCNKIILNPGEVYNYWTVIQKDIDRCEKSRSIFWICSCICGEIRSITGSDLRRGKSKCCGCIKPCHLKDITGKRYGRLVAIKRIKLMILTGRKTKSSIWECKCDCGNLKEVEISCLTMGKVQSCGCLHQEFMIKKNRKERKEDNYQDLSSTHWLSIYKRSLLYPGNMNITKEYLWDLYIKQDKKCALSGIPIKLSIDLKEKDTASLDRINSSITYLIGNVQWVHKEINKMKSNLDEKQFLFWVEQTYFNTLSKNKPSWDQYFLNLAKLVSVRSIDPSTHHGCIVVDKNNRIISTGYNGPIQGVDDSEIPLIRPDKYFYFSHAEQNAIMFCAADMEGSTVYITGRPCSTCTRMLLQKGVKRIVCGPQESKCVNELDIEASNKMLKLSNVSLEFIDSQYFYDPTKSSFKRDSYLHKT